jgi:hypothetical protein
MRQEPASVQTLGPEAAVEGFDEGFVRGLAGAGEVQDDAVLEGPWIRVTRHELRSIVDPDCAGIAGYGRITSGRER